MKQAVDRTGGERVRGGVEDAVARRSRSRGRAVTVVVVHHVVASRQAGVGGLAAIGGVAPPIVDDVVAHVDEFARGAVGAGAVEAGVTTVVMRHEIVMKTRAQATPYPPISVRALAVHRIAQTLGDKRPLQGEICVVVSAEGLVHRPGEAAMVDDDVGGVTTGERVVLHSGDVAQTGPQKPNDNVTGIAGVNGVASQTNPIARRGLAGDGQITL